LTIPWEKSPFQALVYFVGKQTFLNQKWGTRQPITVRDSDFGIVRLRSYGNYAFRVVDAPLLINTLIGTQGKFTTDQIEDYLRDVIVSRLTDLLATAAISLLDLPSKFDEVSAATRVKVGDEFSKFGLELVEFFISAITPPDEVQKAIDARSSMAVIKDLRGYTMYQAANGMRNLAESSGSGGAGIGLGTGIGMMLPGFIQEAMKSNSGGAETTSASSGTMHNGLDLNALASSKPDPKSLVRQVASSNNWKLDEADSHWTLTVPIGPIRKQMVFVKFDIKDEVGHEVIQFFTPCGVAHEETAMTYLRYNRQMVHGAFAVESTSNGEMIVLEANQLADTADPLEVTRAVASIAWQADKIEERLLSNDQF
jgi:hypothetical protein